MYFFVITASRKHPGPMPHDFYQQANQYLQNSFFSNSLISLRPVINGGADTAAIVKANSPKEVWDSLENYPCSTDFNWDVDLFIPNGDPRDINAQWEKLQQHPWNMKTSDFDLMEMIEELASFQPAGNKI